MAGEYIVGQPIELLDAITDPRNNEAAIDDVTTAVTVYLPDGTTVGIAGTHGVTGEYSAVFTPTLPGWHRYIWGATTAAAGKGRERFYVSEP